MFNLVTNLIFSHFSLPLFLLIKILSLAVKLDTTEELMPTLMAIPSTTSMPFPLTQGSTVQPVRRTTKRSEVTTWRVTVPKPTTVATTTTTTTVAPPDFVSMPELDLVSDRPTSVTSTVPPTPPEESEAKDAGVVHGQLVSEQMQEKLIIGGICVTIGLFLGCVVHHFVDSI
jgi:hypothetical protein